MDQLKQLIQAILSGDQQAMQQFQQIIQDPKQGPQVAQAVQQMAQQGDPDAQQLIQMLQQQAPVSAKLGAKLNTIKTLKGICPEGYEMQSYKVGGKVCKKCMKKAQEGGEFADQNGSPADEWKAQKAENGKKLKKPKAEPKKTDTKAEPKKTDTKANNDSVPGRWGKDDAGRKVYYPDYDTATPGPNDPASKSPIKKETPKKEQGGTLEEFLNFYKLGGKTKKLVKKNCNGAKAKKGAEGLEIKKK